MKKQLIFSFLTLFSLAAFAQNNEGYKINVKVKNTSSKEIYLGFHYDNNRYVKDTAKVSKNGEYILTGKNKLERGLYFIVLENMTMFDILIDDNQHFSVETDTLDLVAKAKVTGHELNATFMKFVAFASNKQAKMMQYRNRIKELGENADSTKFYKAQSEKLLEDIKEEQIQISKKYPNSLLDNMFKANKDIENPIKLNTKKDTSDYYYYNLHHYWDNFNWKESGLARTPILHDKLNNYFDKMVMKIPDTLIYYSDFVLKLAEADKENFKYTVQYLYKYFANSKMMCHENVFVHIAKNYYNKDKAWWADDELLGKIQKSVRDMEPTLCGKVAPNLSLADTSGIKFHSLEKMKSKYTVLTFWDPGCGHCQKEIPQLQHLLDSTLYKQGVDVFGVCTQRNLGELKKFLKEKKIKFLNTLVTEEMAKNPEKYIYDLKVTDIQSMNLHQTYNISSTPLVIVLDENKRIIGYKMAVDDIIPFLKNYEKQQEQLSKKDK